MHRKRRTCSGQIHSGGDGSRKKFNETSSMREKAQNDFKGSGRIG